MRAVLAGTELEKGRVMARGKKAVRKLRLTELTVRKARPQATVSLIWDSLQRGLALRVQPTGAKAWVVVYSRQGRSRWLTLGNADAIGLADARLLAAEAMVEVARGRDPAAERKAQRGAGTFAELADRYLDEHAKKHNKSWKQARTLVERYVLPSWAKLQADTITRADAKALLRRIEAPILGNQVLAAASAIFSWAIKEDIIAVVNPCAKVDRNAVKSRERVLADSEVPLFWAAFDDAGLVASTALKTILLTGQRPGECSYLRREHIVDGGWWQMPGEPVPALGWPGTKNGASHRLWMPKAVQELIAELGEADTGFVFAGSRGGPVSDLDGAMREICKRLEIERATPHDLRRTHGSTITSLGFGRDAMNRIQNHREGGIASVYDRHQYADENKQIIEAVAARIMALANGKPEASNVVHMGDVKASASLARGDVRDY